MITRFTSKSLHLLGYSLGIMRVDPLIPGRPRPILISGFIESALDQSLETHRVAHEH